MDDMIRYKGCTLFFLTLILLIFAGSAVYGGSQSSSDYNMPKDVLIPIRFQFETNYDIAI